jgi:hypothetical protein
MAKEASLLKRSLWIATIIQLPGAVDERSYRATTALAQRELERTRNDGTRILQNAAAATHKEHHSARARGH